MTARLRWEHCIANYGEDAIAFANTYFAEPQRRCLFVGGAGFDPRCVTFASILTTHLGDRLQAIFLRERRPQPSPELVSRAERNIEALGKTVGTVQVIDIDVLAEEDGAVIGGRRATEALIDISLDPYTDIVLDLSALSVGISFPIARLLLERANQASPKKNFHLVVVSNAGVDDAINSVPSDFVDPVHGFSGRLDLEGSAQEPKIWMPALAVNKAGALQILREKLRGPVVVCPILPLSQRDPRASDKLVAEFESELYQSWEVDSDNVIYAIEDDPLDLYLIISAIYTRYTRVFANVTNSHVVLTPSGSKTLAIGALMAAIEHDLAVRYVEAVSYEVKWDRVDDAQGTSSIPIHVWLSGDAYPAADAPVALRVFAMTSVFASKLDRIHETLSLCFQTSHVALAHMMAQCAKRPVYCVGSGGSVVVAEFLAQCRAQLGFAMSSSVTPMAFALERSDPAAANWFFSASGENQDIQAAFEYGLRGSPNDLYVLTNARGGTLARLVQEHGGTCFVSPVADEKDGFRQHTR